MQIVSIDIGGTHARFALAEVEAGKVVSLADAVTMPTADHASFQTAWQAFGAHLGGDLPRAVAIAVAGPVTGDLIKFTNNPWIIRPARIREKLNVDHWVLVNDFEAVGHAVAQAPSDHFLHLCGPEEDLPETGTISIVGPGTGLGVAHIWRGDGGYHVVATEGGHIDFAPLDSIEDAILERLRSRYRRVSAERVVSGPGLVDIYEALAGIEGRAVLQQTDRSLWSLGTSGADSLAAAAVDRFCLSLGSIAGDIALAQGGRGVVIAGGLGLRLRDTLAASGFAERFRAKGRFESLMATLPVKLITIPSLAYSAQLLHLQRNMKVRDIGSIMRTSPVIPVLVIENAAHARPIAQALVAGGLRVLEVTLRTAAALEVIQEMKAVEGAIVGAGTVLNTADLRAAIDAGSEFIVSPGLTDPLGRAAIESGVPFLPGIANASDIMRGLDLGLSHFKFFPAEASGGIPALKALSGPFGQAKFCPTGGITKATASDWLALEPVLCVGGSWVVGQGVPDQNAITDAARLAASFAR